LEGVTIETKQLAPRAAQASGLSMHEWLDKVVQQSTKDTLNSNS
jgi:hypothetical protein|tara:strand:+ start:4230 stop:4361 length:132 start_codon:yes stop_codon:yes gene_type:complete